MSIRHRLRPFVSLMVSAAALTAAGCAPDPTDTPGHIVRVRSRGCLGLIEAIGVGFSVDRNLILTAAHVVRGTTSITITVGDSNQRIPAETVAIDVPNDLALLRFDGAALSAFRIGDSHAGEPATLLVPTDSRTPITEGFIDDLIVVNFEEPVDDTRYLRPSVRARPFPLVPGDSGAPLVDENGLVVGLVYADSSVREGLAYAVASSAMHDFMNARPAPTADGPDTRCG